MNGSNKKFARAYVAQNSGHDFTELKALCSEIVFVTTGYDGEETLLPTVISTLANFSPRRDLIVPVGNVYINLLVGIVARELSKDWGMFHVALYREKSYHILSVDVNSIGDLINAYRTPEPS